MKTIKLLLVAIVLLGAIVGLLMVDFGKDELSEPELTSIQANEWKTKINDLCKDGKWTVSGYEQIETGIHTDNTMSDGELINDEEERTLLKYLFALSCSSLYEEADKHFKQTTYSAKNIENYMAAKEFLSEKVDRFGKNSNLTDLSALVSEYNSLRRSLGFSSHAVYTRPLKKFSVPSIEALMSRINGFKHYKSHFSKNTEIQAKVNGLASNRAQAERQYYLNLELLVEKNYKSTGNYPELLEDHMQFEEISTNSDATKKLTTFLSNSEN